MQAGEHIGTNEVMAGDQILSARLGLLERRLATLAGLVVAGGRVPLDGIQDGVPAAWRIDAESQREMATGFHLREYDGAGRPFRWAGRSPHFEFRFFLDRSSARPFQMRGLFAPGVPTEALRAYVDYRAIPVAVNPQDGMSVALGRIPADPLSNAVTLTFFCPSVAPNSEDRRMLSFAFSSLEAGDLPAARGIVSEPSLQPVAAPLLRPALPGRPRVRRAAAA